MASGTEGYQVEWMVRSPRRAREKVMDVGRFGARAEEIYTATTPLTALIIPGNDL